MKTLIKSFAVAAAMLLSASVVAADTSYLYWMTDSLSGFQGQEAWSYAKVAYGNGTGTDAYIYLNNGEQFSTTDTLGGEFMMMQVALGSVVLADSYKFALELFNSTGDAVGISSWITPDASAFGDEIMAPGQATFGSFQIPEPTSGLLMLLGFGALALRRKQKKA